MTLADLPTEVLEAPDSGDPKGPSALKEFRNTTERDFIIAALRKNNGNISQTALELGVRRPYLHRRLGVLQIAKKDYFA